MTAVQITNDGKQWNFGGPEGWTTDNLIAFLERAKLQLLTMPVKEAPKIATAQAVPAALLRNVLPYAEESR